MSRCRRDVAVCHRSEAHGIRCRSPHAGGAFQFHVYRPRQQDDRSVVRLQPPATASAFGARRPPSLIRPQAWPIGYAPFAVAFPCGNASHTFVFRRKGWLVMTTFTFRPLAIGMLAVLMFAGNALAQTAAPMLNTLEVQRLVASSEPAD